MTDPVARRGRVLFVATVYTHLAAFHIPFMKLLQSWGYEVHAAAAAEAGRRGELEAAGVQGWAFHSPARARVFGACASGRRTLHENPVCDNGR